MKIFSKLLVGCAVLAFIACSSGSAYADGLVLVSPQIQKLVPPLASLNLQHHGNSTTESGGVRWNGTKDVWFGDTSAGPHQNTVSLTDLGIGSAADLRVLMNINEANGGTKMPITVDSLVLTAYDQGGNAVFSADLINNAPITLDQFKQGQGANSDWAFGLDSVAAARLQEAINNNPNLRLGLTASLSNVDGGPERFAFGAANQPVPEPATMVLLGTGIAGIAAAARRRRKAAITTSEASDRPVA
jgi:PEP-CTERM motif